MRDPGSIHLAAAQVRLNPWAPAGSNKACSHQALLFWAGCLRRYYPRAKGALRRRRDGRTRPRSRRQPTRCTSKPMRLTPLSRQACTSWIRISVAKVEKQAAVTEDVWNRPAPIAGVLSCSAFCGGASRWRITRNGCSSLFLPAAEDRDGLVEQSYRPQETLCSRRNTGSRCPLPRWGIEVSPRKSLRLARGFSIAIVL